MSKYLCHSRPKTSMKWYKPTGGELPYEIDWDAHCLFFVLLRVLVTDNTNTFRHIWIEVIFRVENEKKKKNKTKAVILCRWARLIVSFRRWELKKLEPHSDWSVLYGFNSNFQTSFLVPFIWESPTRTPGAYNWDFTVLLSHAPPQKSKKTMVFMCSFGLLFG